MQLNTQSAQPKSSVWEPAGQGWQKVIQAYTRHVWGVADSGPCMACLPRPVYTRSRVLSNKIQNCRTCGDVHRVPHKRLHLRLAMPHFLHPGGQGALSSVRGNEARAVPSEQMSMQRRRTKRARQGGHSSACLLPWAAQPT